MTKRKQDGAARGSSPHRESRSAAGMAARRRGGGEMTVALAYPNAYAVAMSSLGYQIVHRGLAAIPGVLCLRVFPPEAGARGRGGLLTYDHPREVAGSDWLAFSVSYENDYPNILATLAAAGLPLEWKERGEGHPLVVVGGIAPSLNPEPLADFADLFVLGEAEEVLEPLTRAYREARRGGLGREEMLLALARIEGIYVPRFYRPRYQADGLLDSFEPVAAVPAKVKRLWVEDLEAYRPDSDVESPDAEFSNMILVEVGRGCRRGCRFCAAGFFYRPLRYRGFAALREAISGRLGESKRFGLLGASVFDHPEIGLLARYLGEHKCSFSVSSVRADAVDAESLARMAAGGLKTVTIAPETGTERLREVIGKPIRDTAIFDAVERISAAGIPNVKLYFMIGLPGETREDAGGIVELVKKVRHHMLAVARGRGIMGSIVVSLACFVPKAWTPFQWHPMEDLDSLEEKQRYVANALRKVPNVKVSHDLPRWAFVQALLSRGDRRVGQVLRLVHSLEGNWKKAMLQSAVNPEFYVHRPRGWRELLPWDFVDTGIEKKYLWKEYAQGLGGGSDVPAEASV